MNRWVKAILFLLCLTLAAGVLMVLGNFAFAEQQPLAPSKQAKPVVVDDFEAGAITNSLGGRTNVFLKAPSKAMVAFRRDMRADRPTNVLLIRYEKKAEGGPYDTGGWCGYYTLLKKAHFSVGGQEGTAADTEEAEYFDASPYSSITIWVKGDKGNENFVLGVADAHWDKIGDSVKSQEIGKYLPAGKITTEWQKAAIPLEEFFIDYSRLSSIAISFESDCFAEGKGSGRIYIDDITLE